MSFGFLCQFCNFENFLICMVGHGQLQNYSWQKNQDIMIFCMLQWCEMNDQKFGPPSHLGLFFTLSKKSLFVNDFIFQHLKRKETSKKIHVELTCFCCARVIFTGSENNFSLLPFLKLIFNKTKIIFLDSFIQDNNCRFSGKNSNFNVTRRLMLEKVILPTAQGNDILFLQEATMSS